MFLGKFCNWNTCLALRLQLPPKGRRFLCGAASAPRRSLSIPDRGFLQRRGQIINTRRDFPQLTGN